MSTEWDGVQAFVTSLREAGLNADVNLEDVNTPGVWVQLRTVEPYTFTAGAVGLRLVCLAGETQADKVYPALIDLYHQLDELVEVAIDGTFVTVVHPEGDELPGLAVPYQLVP